MTGLVNGRTAQRLRGVPPTIFSTMSALALRSGAVNLGQGFPDADGPSTTIETAVAALRGGRNQYAPGPGVPELREAIARHQQRYYGIDLEPAGQVLVTAGATEAIAAAILGLINPGDEVVVIEPYYDSYVACLEMAGAARRPVTLRWPDFRLDPAELAAAVSDRTVAILINSPHNPTGAVLNSAERAAVAEAAIRHDAIVITDEVYEHLTYDGVAHVPLATLPGMFERTLSISSAGKSFSFTGWKVGWVTGPVDLVAAVASAKQWLTFTNASALQPAVAQALDHENDFLVGLAAELTAKRNLLCAGLEAIGLPVVRPQGTYFAISDVRALGYTDGMDFCLKLPERAGVVAIPAQVFYDDPEAGRHLVRWAFCKETSVLEEALSRLAAVDLNA